VILYLNPNWNETWGGEFELWNKTCENCVKKVAPKNNRIVIFDTHDYSFHGSPNPLHCPEDDSRKSIILYYYTKDSKPAEQTKIQEPHSALWKRKEFHDKRGNKTRNYQ
jgi:Rps23 Pro-64 3,4-dihydroxylase Tpa1-like proline 4-hydroxylase